ncbi:transcriptional regulator PpsR [Salipiger mucosus]|uniref:Regulator of carotenoid biosynthesis, Transcriptional regulator, PpsR n=1 Tax=Salipiger mucosus DSM 16094 TaxID=1123237 RepID=S9Q3T0_9RHOB|nr:transcriptional regulator PpsR [Salipiger mucosus]EPX75981.1 Regulator of carotenoid biosynthesis, Transcriptional regulator, PpsR [Salipiger mucosus DSM 16094]
MTRQERTPQPLNAGVLPSNDSIANLFEQAADIALHVDGEGVVAGISVNPDCPSLGCLDHWVGRRLDGFLTEESRVKFSERLTAMRADPARVPRPVELNHIDNATWEFPVRYTLHRVDGGDSILMLGRDMQPIAEMQQRLVREQMARERDQQKLRGETTFFRVVLEASETPLAIVEPQKGRIRDLNSAAASLLGSKVETLSGNAFAQAFEGRRPTEFMETLQAAASAEELRGVEAIARRNGHVIMVYPELFRAAGDLYMLCRLNEVDEEGATGPEAAQFLSALFAETSDAVVLTDNQGVIREANEAFLVLADAAQLRDVRGRSLADFLVRGGIDLKLILEAASKKGRMRSYSAQVASVNGTRAGVDISAARLIQRGGDLGYGFIIRDVTPNEIFDPEAGHMAVSEEAMKNVMDLVGTASLKDLVSATSDVIEKICIETAIQLTGNNRVAAAEMLGLSRQSLYVKLRKHGLLSTDSGDTAD